MFGYIRPMKSELLVKDSELYSAVYCGLCRYGGRHISHLTRWMLNYDFVLLALLRISLSGEKPEVNDAPTGCGRRTALSQTKAFPSRGGRSGCFHTESLPTISPTNAV